MPTREEVLSLLRRHDLDLALPGATVAVPDWAGKRKDEPFAVKDFLQSRMPPESNAAPLYLRGLAPLHPSMDFMLPEEQRSAYQLRVGEFARRLKAVAKYDSLIKDETTRDEALGLLEIASPALKTIDDAQKRDQCLFVTGLMLDSKLFHAEAARQVARLSILELFLASSDDRLDFPRLERALKRTLRLSRDLRPRAPLIGQLVANSIDHTVCQALTTFVLPHQGLNSEQCERLLEILSEHRSRELDGYNEGVRIEYIIIANILHDLQHQRLSPADVDLKNWPVELIDYELEWTTLSRLFSDLISQWNKQPAHRIVRDDTIAQEMKLARQRANKDGYAAASQRRTVREPVICSELIPLNLESRELFIHHRTRQNAVRALLAIRRFELVYGMLPETLLQAVNEFDTTFSPIDLYSGEALKYAIQMDRPLVYSVGQDQKDDGGQVEWESDKETGDLIFRIGR